MSTADNKITKSGLTPLVTAGPAGTDLLKMLQGSQFFGDFPAPQVEKLTGYVQAYSAAAGTEIFREGDRGGFMCLLITGAAEIFKQDNKYGSKRIGRIGPGI